MKVLVINAGSSSLKYQLIDMTTEQMLAKGNCERIGIEGGLITQKLSDGTAFQSQTEFPTHKEAFEKVLEMLTTGESAVISDMKEISAVGHRVVHGGEKFSASTLITDDVIQDCRGSVGSCTITQSSDCSCNQSLPEGSWVRISHR